MCKFYCGLWQYGWGGWLCAYVQQVQLAYIYVLYVYLLVSAHLLCLYVFF